MKVAFEPIPKEFMSETEFCDYKDNMGEALSKIRKYGAVLVFKDGDYYGLVDDRALAASGRTKLEGNFSIGKAAKTVPVLSNDSDIKQAIKVFYETASKAVPLSENGKIKGIINRVDILKSILSLHLLSSYKAGDIMSTPVIAIDQEATINHAKIAMNDNRVNRLVVMDKGKLFGIITYRDIIESEMRLRTRNPEMSPKKRTPTSVGESAHRDVNSIDYDKYVDDAIRELVRRGVSSLLVTRRSKPVGVLSVRDILETIVKNSEVKTRSIVISGLNEKTKEYEGEITDSLENFAEKVDKFKDVEVSYIALNVKNLKTRRYELKARVGLAHGGAVHMYSSGFTLEATLTDLLSKLYRAIETKNDIVITSRKV